MDPRELLFPCVVLSMVGVLCDSGHSQPAENLIAEAGFNDREGVYSDPDPGSPYTLGETVFERGEGEFGWAVGWTVSAGGACCGFGAERVSARGEVTFEGDGTLFISEGTPSIPETWVHRRWSKPLFDLFRIDQYVNLPANANFGSRPFSSSGGGSLASRIGPSWGASGGTFHVFDGDGSGGRTREETGLTWRPNEWYRVSLIVDPVNQTFEFFVDDQKYESPDPLNFRGNPASIDHISYLSSASLRIDAIRITSPPDSSTDRPFRRGDATGNGALDITDPITILGFLFLGAGEIACDDTADVSNDGDIDISDPIALLGFLFLGTLPPLPPFQECGRDTERDELTCISYPPCE